MKDLEEFSELFKSHNDPICFEDFNPCPCKTVDLSKEISYCRLAKMLFLTMIHDDRKNHELLLSKVCPNKRNELQHHDFRARQLKKIKTDFLSKVKPGDKVFCTAAYHDVIFLEPPKSEFGYCKYKTDYGQILEAPASCFRIISKGDKFAEYKTKSKKEYNEYARLARRYGFRVEKEAINGSYLIRIFGDTQEEVDNFLTDLENGLVFSIYDL